MVTAYRERDWMLLGATLTVLAILLALTLRDAASVRLIAPFTACTTSSSWCWYASGLVGMPVSSMVVDTSLRRSLRHRAHLVQELRDSLRLPHDGGEIPLQASDPDNRVPAGRNGR